MKASEIINEAVLGGSVPAGPRTGEDYAYKIMDLRDRIDRATDFSTKEHLKIALNDLQRVALQRGIIDANGKIVFSGTDIESEDFSALTAGTYYLQIHDCTIRLLKR